MSDQKIEALIRDSSVHDDRVLEVLHDYAADKTDEEGEILPLTEEEVQALSALGELLRLLRPAAAERFRRAFLEEHVATCPNCRNRT